MCPNVGIVSLLFCGITLKHYAYHTMSRRTQRTTKYMFSVLAQLSENFIFIYLGLNLFTQDVQVFKPILIIVATVSSPLLPFYPIHGPQIDVCFGTDLRDLYPLRSRLSALRVDQSCTSCARAAPGRVATFVSDDVVLGRVERCGGRCACGGVQRRER